MPSFLSLVRCGRLTRWFASEPWRRVTERRGGMILAFGNNALFSQVFAKLTRMGKRDAQLVTQALYTLGDAREAIENGHSDAALDALEEAQEALVSVKHTPGVSVAGASERLGVSEPTIRSWVKRGALEAVAGASPMQIDPESLHRVSRALAELRQRGQDRDWLQAVVDELHDREARRSDALRKGISQLKRGQLEPA